MWQRLPPSTQCQCTRPTLQATTKTQTYSDWTEEIWDISASFPILKAAEWTISDALDVASDCKSNGDLQWTYSYGAYISGAAYM